MVLPRKNTLNSRYASYIWNHFQTPPSSSLRTKAMRMSLRILLPLLLFITTMMMMIVMIRWTLFQTPMTTEILSTTATAPTPIPIVVSSPSPPRSKVMEEQSKPEITVLSTVQQHEQDAAKSEAASIYQSINSTTTATTTSSKTSSSTPTKIAYAISLIKCGDHQTNAAGLMDAALILRHSIHAISSRSNNNNNTIHKHESNYDYTMVAIVHRQAVECSHVLKQVGFQIKIVDSPIQRQDIQGEYLKKHIHREWCCGHDEFIKWYPYTMTEFPIVVHVDIDFAFLKPMDVLFDAMIYDKNSELGRAARAKLQQERPTDPLPDRIDAFYTRDWPQVVPGRIPGYQAGFVVVRPDRTVFEELAAIVMKGDYVSGFSRANGWGGLGYGGFVGAMAMQGLMAYYYDHVRPNTSVELNQCRYNWMGMDVRYRAAPNFNARNPKVGQCRNDKATCEDCTTTPLEDIYSVHYTQCRKPWNCVGVGAKGGAKGSAIDTSAGSYEKCMQVVTKWHELRRDFETKLFALTSDPRLLRAASQTYMVDVFQGHCAGEGGKNYTQIDASDETFAMVPKLYE